MRQTWRFGTDAAILGGRTSETTIGQRFLGRRGSRPRACPTKSDLGRGWAGQKSSPSGTKVESRHQKGRRPRGRLIVARGARAEPRAARLWRQGGKDLHRARLCSVVLHRKSREWAPLGEGKIGSARVRRKLAGITAAKQQRAPPCRRPMPSTATPAGRFDLRDRWRKRRATSRRQTTAHRGFAPPATTMRPDRPGRPHEGPWPILTPLVSRSHLAGFLQTPYSIFRLQAPSTRRSGVVAARARRVEIGEQGMGGRCRACLSLAQGPRPVDNRLGRERFGVGCRDRDAMGRWRAPEWPRSAESRRRATSPAHSTGRVGAVDLGNFFFSCRHWPCGRGQGPTPAIGGRQSSAQPEGRRWD